jgi:hypothetical protein
VVRDGLLPLRNAAFALVLLILAAPSLLVSAQDLTFKIPPVKSTLNIEDQPVPVSAWGTIAQVSNDREQSVFKLELIADLSGLQQNITPILSAKLNKSDRCGERIAIQRAELTPAVPDATVVTHLHYERWACTKLFGKQAANKLVAGNGVVQVTLTPAVDDHKSLRLVPEVGTIEADGSLGALLRSGPLGEMLREKVRAALLSALQKATDFNATLPPTAQNYASIQKAEFKNLGSGSLGVVLDGEIRITSEQVRQLSAELKQRVAAHQ